MPADLIPSVAARLRAAGCVFAEDEARLLLDAAGTPDDLAAMVARRAAGAPLEQVVGWAEFCGLRVWVDPGVFVPRRRTEFLAEHACALTRAVVQARADGPQQAQGPPTGRIVVVDLCCGSGAVAAAVLSAVADLPAMTVADPTALELHAVDLDPAAVRCARRNVTTSGTHVHQGDLYDPLPAELRGRVDVLIANAPYVPTDAIRLLPAEARLHEARTALDGGPDGLDVLRRVIAAASQWLAPGGHVLVESSERQVPALVEAAHRQRLTARVQRSEDLDATIVVASAG